MLKGVKPCISSDLIKILMDMGHGDELVIADSNFPGASHARNFVRADGIRATELLDAILDLIPLDDYVEAPVVLMKVVEGDDAETPVWDEYRKIVDSKQSGVKFDYIERFEYYERAKSAYAIVQSGELKKYSNILIKKGCI